MQSFIVAIKALKQSFKSTLNGLMKFTVLIILINWGHEKVRLDFIFKFCKGIYEFFFFALDIVFAVSKPKLMISFILSTSTSVIFLCTYTVA